MSTAPRTNATNSGNASNSEAGAGTARSATISRMPAAAWISASPSSGRPVRFSRTGTPNASSADCARGP